LADQKPAASVSVVVCTHTERRYALVRECLDSVAANTVRPHELIVVVDSNPALLERLRADPAVDAQLMASTGRGVSAARNTGVAAATGEIVAFIDDDAVAEPDWLSELCRPFEDPEIVATGGRIVPRWEQPNRLLPDELLWTVGSTYAGHPALSQVITRPVGCNMAANRDALDKVGGFPVEFGPSGPGAKSHSNEEIALALQLRAAYGERCIWYAPAALVRHFVPVERGTWGYLWRRCLAEGISKADVRMRYGAAALGFDRGYVRRTLLPAIGRYTTRSVLRADRVSGAKAVAAAGSLLVTGVAYVARLAARRLRPRSPAAARPLSRRS
jgi:glycosyltransferase involved in cell wall biosynthesis